MTLKNTYTLLYNVIVLDTIIYSSRYSMTALMMASKKGHSGAVKALVESGADVNRRESRGFSVCMVLGLFLDQ